MDNLTNVEQTAADTAEAETEQNAAARLGKFKDVQTLLQAYGNLEAEFTRRSQRLRELEKASKADEAPSFEVNAGAPSPERPVYEGAQFVEAAKNSKEVRDAVIGDYLKSVAQTKAVAFLAGGTHVPAARNSPSTVREAGELVKKLFK